MPKPIISDGLTVFNTFAIIINIYSFTKKFLTDFHISDGQIDSLAKELSCGAVTILDDKTIKQRLKNLSEGLKLANLRVSECDSQINSLEKQKDKVNTMFQTDKIGEADYNKRWQSIQDEIVRVMDWERRI